MDIRKRWNAALGIVLLLASQAAFSGGVDTVREQIESSMLVTGKIQVNAEGRVTAHSLDHPDKVPVGVVRLIGKAVPSWNFEPTLLDGKPVQVATDMRIRVVAHKLDADHYEVAIRSASFGLGSRDPNEIPRSVRMAPPDYPMQAWQAGVTGSVYLLLRVGRDGKVIDAIPEQTNLTFVEDESTMTRWRRVLEDVSMRQARKWTFTPPTQGESAAWESWVVRVPVVFDLGKRAKPVYGRWESYVPGPRQRNPWEHDKEGIGFSPDTLAPGEAYLAGSGLKLLTALSDT